MSAVDRLTNINFLLAYPYIRCRLPPRSCRQLPVLFPCAISKVQISLVYPIEFESSNFHLLPHTWLIIPTSHTLENRRGPMGAVMCTINTRVSIVINLYSSLIWSSSSAAWITRRYAMHMPIPWECVNEGRQKSPPIFRILIDGEHLSPPKGLDEGGERTIHLVGSHQMKSVWSRVCWQRIERGLLPRRKGGGTWNLLASSERESMCWFLRANYGLHLFVHQQVKSCIHD